MCTSCKGTKLSGNSTSTRGSGKKSAPKYASRGVASAGTGHGTTKIKFGGRR